ncbi:MAG: putative cobalt-precorrin-6A synthase (deacetylating) [Methanoregula sp. PtaU1.Bin051]|nr:MAG: putative cobalt-precorrin-6A synthase (deacetylating) [Methanoregula sp. PtaU1.Bin051]
MRDPVTGFEYPEEWVAKCRSTELLEQASKGLAVLTASGAVLRRGYTTGTTAAAACKAAILSLKDDIESVTVTIPCSLTVDVPVKAAGGTAECRKYGGDYPSDETAGITVIATAVAKDNGLDLVPGAGIGMFVRDTPRFRKGTPAITPAPLACILRSMEEALKKTGLSGAAVLLEIPEGAAVAARTLNKRVGVEGGISVLGTTGLVEPWDDHLTASAIDRITRASKVVLTTGRIGLRHARLRYPDYEVVLIGSKIRDALAASLGEVILFGLPALILKYIKPDILAGTGYTTVEELSISPGFAGIVAESLAEFQKEMPDVRVVLISREGEVIGESR